MQRRSRSGMRRVLAVVVMALTGAAGIARPSSAEFYTTRALLDQKPEDQRVYVIGMIDMYEFAREDFAADPDDWLVSCMNDQTGSDVAKFFVDWLLLDPASWRFHPAQLFIEAMDELCN